MVNRRCYESAIDGLPSMEQLELPQENEIDRTEVNLPARKWIKESLIRAIGEKV